MKVVTKHNKKEILILGLGITGQSILKFLRKQNIDIFIWDDLINLKKNNLKNLNIYNPSKKKISDFSQIFVSPGFKKSHVLIKKAVEKKINLSNDIELFWEQKVNENIYSRVIGITGTNGKSTIALLIANVLDTIPLGNYGNPVLDNLRKKNKDYVIELSSFQLEYINKFKPKVSIISNIEIDHLNHHKTFKNYLKAKFNIIKNQNKDNYLIINNDDKNIRDFLIRKNRNNVNIIKVSNKKYLKDGIIYKNSTIYDNFITFKKYKIKQNTFLKLTHNQLNYTIAFAALLALKINPLKIIKVLNKFKGLPHRLEFIGSIKKVNFYNDSKATNVAATCSAINSFKKVILIAGGSDKGESFNELKKYKNIIIEAFLIGENANKIQKNLNKLCLNRVCNNLSEAVEKSYIKSLSSGNYYPVIFSPASASFDKYKNFEDRGNHFKKIFKDIKRKVA